MPDDEFERLVQEFEKFQSKVQRLDDQFAGVDQMQAELQGLEAAVVSPDRSVKVVAGAGGSVTDIQLSEAAMRQGHTQLAASILQTLQQAVAEAARAQAGVVDAYMGDGGLGASERVLEAQAQLFGKSVEELRAESGGAPAPPSGSGTAAADEDLSEQSIFDRGDTKQAPPAQQPPSPSSGTGSAGDQFLQSLFNHEEDR